jgi:four helix bundle protein
MKYPPSRKTGSRGAGGDPKVEIRRPKEGRGPKVEEAVVSAMDSDFWIWGDEPNAELMVLREEAPTGSKPLQDLGERTALFGESVIAFAKKVPENPVNNRLISQLVGAATSVGANYCEADDAVSGKEFKQKIGTSRKESKEAMFFLRMVATSEPHLKDDARNLWREAKELNLIFGAIWRK